MNKMFDYRQTRGRQALENTYDQPIIDDADADIEDFIERERLEYHRQWISYLGDYEQDLFLEYINIIK